MLPCKVTWVYFQLLYSLCSHPEIRLHHAAVRSLLCSSFCCPGTVPASASTSFSDSYLWWKTGEGAEKDSCIQDPEPLLPGLSWLPGQPLLPAGTMTYTPGWRRGRLYLRSSKGLAREWWDGEHLRSSSGRECVVM